MKILIDIYRGFDIQFDTEKDTFSAFPIHTHEWSADGKSSFATTKKAIDEYLKKNQDFRPIEVYRHGQKETIVGIRKDGRAVFADKSHHEKSKYSIWPIATPETTAKFAEIQILESEIKALQNKITEINSTIPDIDWGAIKAEYGFY